MNPRAATAVAGHVRLLAVLLSTALLPAQDPGERLDALLRRELTAQLASEDTRVVAWGAHLCAEHRVQALVPELRAALRRFGADRPQARRFAFLALLDALVQTGAKVPFEELTPAIDEFTLEPVLLLAARDPTGAEAFLLERFGADEEKGPYPRWVLAGNLLAAQRSPAFGARLFGELRYRLDLQVVDDDPREPEYDYSGGGGGGGSGPTVPAGYPPTVLYELRAGLEPGPGAVVAATGDTLVYYLRKPTQTKTLSFRRSWSQSAHRQIPRVNWLATMLDDGLAPIRANLDRTAELRWTDAATLRADVERLRGEIAAVHSALRAQCRKAGWLGDDAASTPLPLTIRVQDLRGDTKTPLPTIE